MEEPWNDPGTLARRFAPAIYRLAYARTGSRADAEDVMQEVFLRLVRHRPVFDSEAHARAWLLEAGFDRIRTYGDCRMSGPKEDAQRIYFSAIRDRS